MCGRYAITLPTEAMVQMFDAVPANDLPEPERYNVCPTTQVAVVSAGEGGRRLRSMRWGLIPHWAKAANDGPLLINARAETVAEKPAFRAAVRERRCLIPASGFFEWTKDEEGGRDPWYITRADGAPLVFAGIWQDWARGEDAFTTCAILTCAANEAVSAIHHRMPVILEAGDWADWLGETGAKAAPLMVAAGEDVLRWHRVDRAVNSNRAQGPQLIEEI